MKVSNTQIKNIAKAIKATGKFTHSEALELVAKGLGFANWQTLQGVLDSPSESVALNRKPTDAAETFLKAAAAAAPNHRRGRKNIRLAHFDVFLAYEQHEGAAPFDPESLAQIEEAMNDSDIGTWEKTCDIAVPPHQVVPLLLKLGNDGNFFSSFEDEDELYRPPPQVSVALPKEATADLEIPDEIQLSDGTIRGPDRNGIIRRYDTNLNVLEVRKPTDPNYGEWANEFTPTEEIIHHISTLNIDPEVIENLVRETAQDEVVDIHGRQINQELLDDAETRAQTIIDGGLRKQIEFIATIHSDDTALNRVLKKALGKKFPRWTVKLTVYDKTDGNFVKRDSIEFEVDALSQFSAIKQAKEFVPKVGPNEVLSVDSCLPN